MPALRALRAAAPAAHISLIGLPWASEFCARFPGYIDEFVPFPGYPGLPEQIPELDVIPLFIERMQARRFDLTLQLHGSGAITNPLALMFGAKRTAGFYAPDAFCPDEALFMQYPDDLPERIRLLKLVEFLGDDAGNDRLEFPLTDVDRAELDALGVERARSGPVACLHPGARQPVRRWPAAKFATVGDALAERGFAVVITGSAWERSIAEEVQRAMRAPALNLAGLTGLGAAAALLATSRVLICNDTG
ncbi:MAG TPA: glycosyltransferase family 9 protein, partial [Dehalococcoidia bacterium]|nr:glycosyltransferase family 9 protein [Dehalococcoidia bacterium]